ncbi:MAG: ribulose-phosphate 3-epimerase [Acidimicrobiia bacterium]|nr:ribulose-phosphate 3-epimerase [Acidimicrobiia bacterium]MDH5504670.1 ribulose-phosphate 3-epimerase [Acidimicrobiia bacterium]
MTIKIAPSILAADFARLGEEIERIADHVDMLHIDVMDGHFVPNLSLGFPVIASIRKITDLYFDCHMMTSNPDWYIDSLVGAGGNLLSVHIEVFPDPSAVHRKAVEAGLDFGLVLNPQTPVAAVEPFLDLCNQVLVMSVEPGFGGQSFIPAALPKAEQLRRLIDRAGLAVDLQIDGGVTVETAPLARGAGVNVFVAGSAIFGKADPVAAVAGLRNAIGG